MRLSRFRYHPVLWLFVLLLFTAAAQAAPLQCLLQECAGHGPDTLLHLMQQCRAENSAGGLRCPCAEVKDDAAAQTGYVLLKDCRGIAQFLLLPSATVSGIEDPVLQGRGQPDYFALAWQHRFLVEQALGHALAPEQFSLAVNAQNRRSQNQLHIHMDCLAGDIRQLLRAEQKSITAGWQTISVPLNGHVWHARRIPGKELTLNPFNLLFAALLQTDGAGQAQAEMGRHNLLLTSVIFVDGPGFVLLDSTEAAAEDLQDHSCADAPEVR
jgi:CDP-diacylglycerol pyrophosphatase